MTIAAIVWAICAITLYASFWIVRWYGWNVLALQPAAALVLGAAFVAVVGVTDLYLHASTVPYAWSQASATAQLCLLLSVFFFLKAFVHGRSQSFHLACSGLLYGLAALSKQNYLFSCLNDQLKYESGIAYLVPKHRHWNYQHPSGGDRLYLSA